MSHTIRQRLKSIPLLRFWVVILRVFQEKHSLIKKGKLLKYFFSDYRQYQQLPTNLNFRLDAIDIYPRVFDKTAITPIDPVYFYQDCWCAKKVFEQKPAHHYDIGSQAELVGILSQFTPTTMVDIRPIPLTLPNLSFMKGDITQLPFSDHTISSLSSICVIEHIGLGRYGDPLDAFGSEKAIAEMVRVLAPQGNLYISVPVDSVSRVCFNAHRTFTRDQILQAFSALTLVEEHYIYGQSMMPTYDAAKGFGTGLYHFRNSHVA